MKRLLVTRFSALGDVAMTLPVLKRVLHEFPQTEITIVTNSRFAPLFKNIERLRVVGVDFKKEYKGLSGLFRLATNLKSEVRPNAFIDLHGVLRTYILTFFIRLSGIPSFSIRKDRQVKKQMIRTKILKPLPHTTERYLDVFRRAGYVLPAKEFSLPSVSFSKKDMQQAEDFISADALPAIAIAPFAKHETKTLPLQTSESLLEKLHGSFRIFLLGGPDEEAIFNEWEKKFNNVRSTGNLSLVQQVALISKMKAVISMDSGNMHLAAIQGVPVISIWGATHPYLGFSGIQTPEWSRISTEKKLPCRPCSVFGNKPCSHREEPLVCLKNITAQTIIATLQKAISQ